MGNEFFRYGYARASTDDQDMTLQLDALKRAECTSICSDDGVFDEATANLDELVENLQAGDTLVVWRLDRLGRSLRYLVDLIDQLGRKGVHFVSLTENIDTTHPEGRLLFHMMAALSEFERSLISERTKAGMAAARAAGKHVGRKPSLNHKQRAEIKKAVANEIPVETLARQYDVHPRTIRRIFEATKSPEPESK